MLPFLRVDLMHMPDGYLDPHVCALTYLISAIFLFWAWRKMKATYPRAVVPLLALSSAFVFAAQMLNFPCERNLWGKTKSFGDELIKRLEEMKEIGVEKWIKKQWKQQ